MRQYTRQEKSLLSSLIQQHNSGCNEQICPKMPMQCCIRQPRDANIIHSQGFPSPRATEKMLATGRVAQQVAFLDLLLFQELKPFGRNDVKTTQVTFPSNYDRNKEPRRNFKKVPWSSLCPVLISKANIKKNTSKQKNPSNKPKPHPNKQTKTNKNPQTNKHQTNKQRKPQT